MGRQYGSILGLLAMSTVLTRGAISGANVEGTIITAIACLFVFAAIGLLIGLVAEATVDESVRSRLQSQLHDFDDSAATDQVAGGS